MLSFQLTRALPILCSIPTMIAGNNVTFMQLGKLWPCELSFWSWTSHFDLLLHFIVHCCSHVIHTVAQMLFTFAISVGKLLLWISWQVLNWFWFWTGCAFVICSFFVAGSMMVIIPCIHLQGDTLQCLQRPAQEDVQEAVTANWCALSTLEIYLLHLVWL